MNVFNGMKKNGVSWAEPEKAPRAFQARACEMRTTHFGENTATSSGEMMKMIYFAMVKIYENTLK